jgi:hypothetical protein
MTAADGSAGCAVGADVEGGGGEALADVGDIHLCPACRF